MNHKKFNQLHFRLMELLSTQASLFLYSRGKVDWLASQQMTEANPDLDLSIRENSLAINSTIAELSKTITAKEVTKVDQMGIFG